MFDRESGTRVTTRALALLGSVIGAGLAVIPVAHGVENSVGDTTAPTGTYTLSTTSTYLLGRGHDPRTGELRRRATVEIRERWRDDPGAIRSVISEPGARPVAWPVGAVFAVSYTREGTFTPVVRLSDAAGNATEIKVAPVTIVQDRARPQLKVRIPKKSTRISSWKVARGTASDRGSGLKRVHVFLTMGDDRGRWSAYNFATKRWHRVSDPAAEGKRFNAKPQAVTVKVRANGSWVTPSIKGMRKGQMWLETYAEDRGGNVTGRHVFKNVR